MPQPPQDSCGWRAAQIKGAGVTWPFGCFSGQDTQVQHRPASVTAAELVTTAGGDLGAAHLASVPPLQVGPIACLAGCGSKKHEGRDEALGGAGRALTRRGSTGTNWHLKVQSRSGTSTALRLGSRCGSSFAFSAPQSEQQNAKATAPASVEDQGWHMKCSVKCVVRNGGGRAEWFLPERARRRRRRSTSAPWILRCWKLPWCLLRAQLCPWRGRAGQDPGRCAFCRAGGSLVLPDSRHLCSSSEPQTLCRRPHRAAVLLAQPRASEPPLLRGGPASSSQHVVCLCPSWPDGALRLAEVLIGP